MDISDTLAPKSDQLGADDFISGPRALTITGVSRGDSEQPVNIITAEFGDERPYRPCKSMRRVLVQAWGTNASEYIGRRLMLFNDQSVKWAGQSVGGVRISAMSHIPGRMTISLTTTRGKRAPFTVDPLPDAPAAITQGAADEFEARITAAATVDDLDAIAKDLKACDLGQHRAHLQATWGARRTAIQDDSEKGVG